MLHFFVSLWPHKYQDMWALFVFTYLTYYDLTSAPEKLPLTRAWRHISHDLLSYPTWRRPICELSYYTLRNLQICHNRVGTLQWRHNERDGVSNHQRLDGLPKGLFRRRSKKASKSRVTGLCEGNPPSQSVSNVENVFIHLMTSSWRDRFWMYLHFLSFVDATNLNPSWKTRTRLSYSVCRDVGSRATHGAEASAHDDVIKWKHFPRYWPFVRGIRRSPGIPHKKASDAEFCFFSLICARINGWVNNGEAGDLRRNLSQ